MKIWVGYGSEHSANLVIIGTFKSAKDAHDALNLLNEATRIARADEEAGYFKTGSPPPKFSDAMMKFFSDRNFMSFGRSDPENLLYDHSVTEEREKLIITTDEEEITPFLKIFINGGAKIEVFSAHNYPGKYGRGRA